MRGIKSRWADCDLQNLSAGKSLLNLDALHCFSAFVPVIPVFPMLADCIARFCKPFQISPNFFERGERKKLRGVLCGMAEWFEEPFSHQNGNFMRRESKIPGCLFSSQPRWRGAQIQELVFFRIHGGTFRCVV
jgi:hypothetical protein